MSEASHGRIDGRGPVDGVRDDGPGQRLPRQRKKQFNPLFLKPEDVGRLQDALDASTDPRRARDRALAAILCRQGLRCNEARMLDIADIRFSDQDLIIRHAKGGKQRTIPLFEDVAERIMDWLAERPEPQPGHEDALFLSSERTRLANRTIRTDAKRWAQLAGLDPAFHPHTGRHSTAVALLEHGVRLEAVRDMLGHSNLSITNTYVHCTAATLRSEVAKAGRL